MWEGYLVGVSLGTMYVLMIGTGKGSLVGLSLGLPLGSPLEYPNPGLTGIILDKFLEIFLDTCLNLFGTSIFLVLGLALVNYFDTSSWYLL